MVGTRDIDLTLQNRVKANRCTIAFATITEETIQLSREVSTKMFVLYMVK